MSCHYREEENWLSLKGPLSIIMGMYGKPREKGLKWHGPHIVYNVLVLNAYPYNLHTIFQNLIFT